MNNCMSFLDRIRQFFKDAQTRELLGHNAEENLLIEVIPNKLAILKLIFLPTKEEMLFMLVDTPKDIGFIHVDTGTMIHWKGFEIKSMPIGKNKDMEEVLILQCAIRKIETMVETTSDMTEIREFLGPVFYEDKKYHYRLSSLLNK